MPTIGQLKKTDMDDPAFTGRIRTLTFNLSLTLRPLPQRQESSPSFEVCAEGVTIGSAWKKVSDRGDKFLSLTLDDPSWPAALNLAAFPGEDGILDVVWTRPRGGRDAA